MGISGGGGDYDDERLRRRRVHKGWSGLRLIQGSGTLQPRNPRELTRRKLSAAPQRQPADVARREEVSEYWRLVDFNPYGQNSLPEFSGVYVLYDVANRPST